MDAGLNRLRFEHELERAFVDDHGRRSISVVRAFFGIAFLIVFFGTVVQLFSGKPELQTFIRVALGIISPICALIFASTFHPNFGRASQLLVTLGTVAISWGILYVWYIYPDHGFWYYGSLAVALVTPLTYTISRLRFYWAVISAWTSLAIYMVYATKSGVFEGATIYQPVYVLMSNLFSMLAGYYVERAARRDFLLSRMLEVERSRTEAVLANILPDRIAARLKNEECVIADLHEDVIVLFADIVDFTKFASNLEPEEVVRALDEVFTELDDLAERYELEKIKTIGDAYMVVAGLPDAKPDDDDRLMKFALEMSRLVANRFQMRIGIHCGPVVAGVIGKRKQVYDLWGDTVNTASRMETTGEPGLIHMSEEFANRIKGRYPLVDRGVVTIKGKGAMRTYAFTIEVPESVTSPVQ